MLKRPSWKFFLTAVILLAPSLLRAQGGLTGGAAGPQADANILANFSDPLIPTGSKLVCGDITQAGTPITGDANGADNDLLTIPDNGTSGRIIISGIPSDAVVSAARLYWTVLTDDLETSNVGMNITLDPPGPVGPTAIAGTKLATANKTPCFSQANTIAWYADVPSLVSSPGNGTYIVAGFPGANVFSGPVFVEGATLQVLWSNEASRFRRIVRYEAAGGPGGVGGLPVTDSSGQTLTQALNFASTPASTTGSGITARLLEVIGNGQTNATEQLNVTAGAGIANLDNSLDGSTTAIPAANCSYTDDGNVECFWDDDKPDVSSAFLAGDTSATLNYQVGSDCHDFPAVVLSVKTATTLAQYCTAGGSFVDSLCPANGTWANHGDYVSCVANAANLFVAENNLVCSTSCIVNPRARSNVGKK